MNQNAHQQPNRWLRPLLVSSGYLGAVFAMIWMTQVGMDYLRQPSTLPVQQIRFATEPQYSDTAHLRQELRPWVSTGLFAVNVGKVKSVLEDQPWIALATVRRSWPSTLELFVQEHQPFARFGEDALVTTEGEIIRPQNVKNFASLPQLIGDPQQAKKMVAAARLLQQNQDLADWSLRLLRQDKYGALRAEFGNGPELFFGASSMNDSLQRLASALPSIQRIASKNKVSIDYLDLRYQHGIAAAWQPLAEPIATAKDGVPNNG